VLDLLKQRVPYRFLRRKDAPGRPGAPGNGATAPARRAARSAVKQQRRQRARLDARQQTQLRAARARDGRALLFGWGRHLTRSEKEALQRRLAVLGAVLVFSLVAAILAVAFVADEILPGLSPVATVHGTEISLRTYATRLGFERNRLRSEFQNLQVFAGTRPQNDPARQLAQQQLIQVQEQLFSVNANALELLIDEELVRQEARKRGLSVSRAEIDAELQKRFAPQDEGTVPTPGASPTAAQAGTGSEQPDAAATPAATVTALPTPAPTSRATTTPARTLLQSRLRDFLQATGVSEGYLRRTIEADLLKEKLRLQLAEQIPAVQEQVHARHILVSDEEKAREVLRRIEAGERFEDVAAEVSQDPGTKDQGGDLGWFPRGIMVTEFEEAAFALQPGQLSRPVQTQFGYHVIRVDERAAGRPVESDQLEQLKRYALNKWLQQQKNPQTVQRFDLTPVMAWADKHAPRPRQSAALRGA
jgi:parvulin-like peptidyl-prolyl isomerase